MQHNNFTNKPLQNNNEVIKTIIKLRNSKDSIFNLIPTDITDHMMAISKNLPISLLDKLLLDLDAVCDDYINDYSYFQNKHSDVARKTKEFIKLLQSDIKIGQTQAFIYFVCYSDSLISHLQSLSSKKFLNKLSDFFHKHEIVPCNLINTYYELRNPLSVLATLIMVTFGNKNLHNSFHRNINYIFDSIEESYQSELKDRKTEQIDAINKEIQHYLYQPRNQLPPSLRR